MDNKDIRAKMALLKDLNNRVKDPQRVEFLLDAAWDEDDVKHIIQVEGDTIAVETMPAGDDFSIKINEPDTAKIYPVEGQQKEYKDRAFYRLICNHSTPSPGKKVVLLISWGLKSTSDDSAVLAAILAALNIYVDNEVPLPAPDGLIVDFTTQYDYKPGTTKIWLNTVRLREGVGFDYIENGGNDIKFAVAPMLGDSLIIDYIKL